MLNLDDEASLSQPDVRLALATELFKCGYLSLGRAAKLANTPVVDFMRHLSGSGISYYQGTANSAKKALKELNKWAASS